MKNRYPSVRSLLFFCLTLNWILFSVAGCQRKIRVKPADASQKAITTTPAPPPVAPVMADAKTILSRPQVPILCYHQLRDFRPADSKTAKDYIVPVANFNDQVKSLADSGYHSILPDQLYDYLAYGKALPEKPVMFTFDDTREEHFTVAAADLNKYGFKGVFFIMTVSLNRPGYMTKEQVRQLADEGHVVGLHTWNHKNVKTYTDEDWQVQIEKPLAQLRQITGKPVDYFAYPFGLWNEAALDKIRSYGFKSAFQLSAKREENFPLFNIRRIIVPGEWSTSTLKNRMRNSF